MIKNIEELKKFIEPLPPQTPVRVAFDNEKKRFPFAVTDLERAPVRDEHGNLSPILTIVVKDPQL